MISHRHRAIFVHVPKTAGTSIEAALGHHHGGVVRRDAQDHRTLRQLQWPGGGLRQLTSGANAAEAARALRARIRPPAQVANRAQVSRAQYRRYFKFAVVRNPWSRTYSCYRNVCADPLHQQRLGVPADLGFGAFVQRFAGRDMLRPQLYWLLDFSGRPGLDLICRFEHLERDCAEVFRRTGITVDALPHLNHTDGTASDYLAAYDDRTVQIVADRFRAEIELFGYTLDGPPPRTLGAPRG